MAAKIRDAQILKTPYMLVIGDREMEQGEVTLRFRTGESVPALSKEEIITLLVETASSRSWNLGQTLVEKS